MNSMPYVGPKRNVHQQPSKNKTDSSLPCGPHKHSSARSKYNIVFNSI